MAIIHLYKFIISILINNDMNNDEKINFQFQQHSLDFVYEFSLV